MTQKQTRSPGDKARCFEDIIDDIIIGFRTNPEFVPDWEQSTCQASFNNYDYDHHHFPTKGDRYGDDNDPHYHYEMEVLITNVKDHFYPHYVIFNMYDDGNYRANDSTQKLKLQLIYNMTHGCKVLTKPKIWYELHDVHKADPEVCKTKTAEFERITEYIHAMDNILGAVIQKWLNYNIKVKGWEWQYTLEEINKRQDAKGYPRFNSSGDITDQAREESDKRNLDKRRAVYAHAKRENTA